MSEFKWTKSTVDIYKVRNGHTWADFVIDDLGGGKGQILINSDYGSWAYFWGACGEGGIKKFLLRADNDYIMGKFSGPDKWFDEEATKEAMRKQVNESYTDGDTSEDDWTEMLEEIDNADWSSPEALYHTMSERLNDEFPDYPPIITDYHPCLRNFMTVFFDEFRNMLRDEIESNIPKQPA